jgi:hypothetical protein
MKKEAEILFHNIPKRKSNKEPLDLKKAYDIFDWKYYIEYYNDVSKKNITNKLYAWNDWYNWSEKEDIPFFSKIKKKELTYETFDWISYISINDDLSKFSREEAWTHWNNYGIKECRGFRRFNDTCIHKARFGNLFFINIAFHFIAIKNDLQINYKYYDKFVELGIRFYNGKKTYKENEVLSDANFLELVKSNKRIDKNLIINVDHFFCQSKDFAIFIKEQFELIFKENVKKKNRFKERYKNNKDVFLHVRLGDLTKELVKDKNKAYFEKALSKIKFKTGYISSDSIESPFCKDLIEKYNLKIIELNEIETIMFASTCNSLILSGGTFSWLIGFLAFYSKQIFYPKYTSTWYADIFVFKNWTAIEVD